MKTEPTAQQNSSDVSLQNHITQPPTVRKATGQDIGRICEIYHRIHQAEERGVLQIGWARHVYPTEATATDALVRGELFVMEDQGNVVASAIYNHKPMPEYYEKWPEPCDYDHIMVIHTLVVDPYLMRKGYGEWFVRDFERQALAQGCHTVRLDTQSKNHAARAMYRKLGYTEAHATTCCFNGIPGRHLLILEKKF